jgi:U3 small nucleolar RNA-associated protein 6
MEMKLSYAESAASSCMDVKTLRKCVCALCLINISIFRKIVKKRKEFEYKIQRRTKCKEDYLRYIQFEMHLLKLTRLRREVSYFK